MLATSGVNGIRCWRPLLFRRILASQVRTRGWIRIAGKDLFADKQIFSSKYELTAASLIKFEVKSLLGRMFLRKAPPLNGALSAFFISTAERTCSEAW